MKEALSIQQQLLEDVDNFLTKAGLFEIAYQGIMTESEEYQRLFKLLKDSQERIMSVIEKSNLSAARKNKEILEIIVKYEALISLAISEFKNELKKRLQ